MLAPGGQQGCGFRRIVGVAGMNHDLQGGVPSTEGRCGFQKSGEIRETRCRAGRVHQLETNIPAAGPEKKLAWRRSDCFPDPDLADAKLMLQVFQDQKKPGFGMNPVVGVDMTYGQTA